MKPGFLTLLMTPILFFFLLGYKNFYTSSYNSITSEIKSFLKITYMGLSRNVLNETARVEILSRV